ncbi:MAG: hypothetical protein WD471_02170 [Candidatus Paceibacterota bacterium]
MDNHFVCTGKCGGVSNASGVCSTEDCNQAGNSLKECSCDSDSHLDKIDNSESSDSEQDN